jgi:hypothetical protein
MCRSKSNKDIAQDTVMLLKKESVQIEPQPTVNHKVPSLPINIDKAKASVLKPNESIEDIDDPIAFSRTLLKSNPSLDNPDAPFEYVYNQVKKGKMDYATMRGLYG